jgi:hypothetical protein
VLDARGSIASAAMFLSQDCSPMAIQVWPPSLLLSSPASVVA